MAAQLAEWTSELQESIQLQLHHQAHCEANLSLIRHYISLCENESETDKKTEYLAKAREHQVAAYRHLQLGMAETVLSMEIEARVRVAHST